MGESCQDYSTGPRSTVGNLSETDASLTADPGVTSLIPSRSHTFVEIDHSKFLRSLFALPLNHSRRVVVSYKRKYSLLSIPQISRDWAKYVELSVVRGIQIMMYTYHFGAK